MCGLAKSGSFGFAEGRLCGWGKAKCATCGLAKITRLFNLSFSGARECFAFVFKKCAVGKK
jgi:hypothetical protein